MIHFSIEPFTLNAGAERSHSDKSHIGLSSVPNTFQTCCYDDNSFAVYKERLKWIFNREDMYLI
jgi:hypothetical protein